MTPPTGLSTVLIEFARPLVDASDPSLGRDAFRQRMQIAVTVWNAVTISQWGKGEGFINDARFSVAAMGSNQTMTLFEGLVKRKRELYGDDLRAIAKFSVVPAPEGGFSVRVKLRKRR